MSSTAESSPVSTPMSTPIMLTSSSSSPMISRTPSQPATTSGITGFTPYLKSSSTTMMTGSTTTSGVMPYLLSSSSTSESPGRQKRDESWIQALRNVASSA